jgi:tetratricopeptide (TPR) repeat protein
MDWSYELLTPEEQSFLQGLAAFRGSFTLEAAAAVCLEGEVGHALDLVGRLVDASLVVPRQHEGTTRFRLLETVRQYALERSSDDHRGKPPAEERLTRYVVGLLEATHSAQESALQEWVAALEPERGNVRAALTWSRDEGEHELLLRLVSGAWRSWWVNGDLDEGTKWLETALARSHGTDPALRAASLEGAAGLAWARGDLDRASEHAESALSLFTDLEDRRGEQAALIVLGLIALSRRQYDQGQSAFERCRQLAEQHGPRATLAIAHHNLASVAYGEGELARATTLYRQARSLFEQDDDAYGVALSDLFLGLVDVEAGCHEDAAVHFRVALRVFRRMRFQQYASECLGGFASVVRARKRPQEATRLLAAASVLRKRSGIAAGVASGLWERERDAARSELGEASFVTAWEEGLVLREAEALDRAEFAVAV